MRGGQELGEPLADGFLEGLLLAGRSGAVAGKGEVVTHQRAPLGQHGRPPERVLQLAHVARPAVAHERLADVVGHPDDAGAELAVDLVDEEVDQLGDVRAPIPERRHEDAHHVQAEEQILAEAAAADGALEILVRRRDDADVGADRLATTDPRELALLEHAQELGLERERHVADLVEEEGATGRGLELADAALDGAGERAALVAEELALEQLVGDRGAVEGDERPAAIGMVMDRAGDELLAGAGLALDQDRGVGRRHATDHLVDLLHGGGAADDELLALLELAPQALEVVRQTTELERAVDQHGDLIQVEGLRQVVVRAALGGLDRVGHRVLRGHDDDQRVDLLLARLGEDVEPRYVRHADVEEGNVVGLAPQGIQGLAAAADGGDFVTLLAARALEDPADRLFVVRDQDMGRGSLSHCRHRPRWSAG